MLSIPSSVNKSTNKMTGNYAKIVRDNLERLYGGFSDERIRALPCTLKDKVQDSIYYRTEVTYYISHAKFA